MRLAASRAISKITSVLRTLLFDIVVDYIQISSEKLRECEVFPPSSRDSFPCRMLPWSDAQLKVWKWGSR
jgi:hypothetical protein